MINLLVLEPGGDLVATMLTDVVPRVGEVINVVTPHQLGDDRFNWRVDHVIYETAGRGSLTYKQAMNRAGRNPDGDHSGRDDNYVHGVTVLGTAVPNPYERPEAP